MKKLQPSVNLSIALLVFALVGCSRTNTQSQDVAGTIRQSLRDSGLTEVSVSQDRARGVVTLDGQVPSDNDRARAESIAKSVAANQVVANQVAVVPRGVEKETKAVNSDLDKGIDNNLDAAFIQYGFKDVVTHKVKNGVVTLTGNVDSQAKRSQAEKIAAQIPYVQQVVNELQVKEQKATSTR